MQPLRRDSQNRLLCTAQRKHGRGQCNAPAIAGGRVCRVHGGAAPQVKRVAGLRLAELVDPAIAVLSKAMRDYCKEPNVAVRAALGSLDRNGFGPTTKLEHMSRAPIEKIDPRELLARRIAELRPSKPDEKPDYGDLVQ